MGWVMSCCLGGGVCHKFCRCTATIVLLWKRMMGVLKWIISMLLCYCFLDCVLHPLGPRVKCGIDVFFIGQVSK